MNLLKWIWKWVHYKCKIQAPDVYVNINPPPTKHFIFLDFDIQKGPEMVWIKKSDIVSMTCLYISVYEDFQAFVYSYLF